MTTQSLDDTAGYDTRQVASTSADHPSDVRMLVTLEEEGAQKISYQLGGLTLALTYLERIGLVEVVNRYCVREGGISDGVVMTVHLSCTLSPES